MFIASGIDAHSWLKSASGRSKRQMLTKVGFFVIEHVATGQLIIEAAKNVSEAVDAVITQLELGTYYKVKFQRTVFLDTDLRVYEYATTNLKDAQKAVAAAKQTVTPQYLLH